MDRDSIDDKIKRFNSNPPDNRFRKIGKVLSLSKISFVPKDQPKLNGLSIYFTSGRFVVREESRGIIIEKYFVSTGDNDTTKAYDTFPVFPVDVVLEFETSKKTMRLLNVYTFDDIIGRGK